MPPSPWELPEIDFVLSFVVPAAILAVNILFKLFWLKRGVELAGADLALCGFSILLTQTLRAIHSSRLPPDLIVLTILVLGGILVLWITSGGLVRDAKYSKLGLFASFALGGLVFYSCIRYWAFVQSMGYRWGG